MLVNIRDFGAVGNKTTKDTKSIQAAIDNCFINGGGTVLVPKGQFLSGSIILKSNVNLHLEAGARIVSSLSDEDFVLPDSEDSNNHFYSVGQGKTALICARHAEKISITGAGTIDGRGEQFLEPEDGINDYVLNPLGGFRPKLIDFEGCTDLLFQDVTLYHASSWGLHITGCNRVNINGIKILGQHRGPNNDGIDPDSCQNVHISNCHVETGDDCIVIKTTKYGAKHYGPCENITVTNCTLMSHDSAIKIGTETHGDIRNIVIQNCVINNSNRGIGLWARDGSTLENMLFSNIIIETRLYSDEIETSRNPRWWGKGEPIFMTSESRNGESYPGKIRNITFNNILTEAEGGVYIDGSEESIIEGISIKALKHTMRVKSGFPGGLFDTQPSTRGVFPHHIPAIFCRYASNIYLDDVEVIWKGSPNKNWTNAFNGENTEQLTIKGFRGKSAAENYSTIELKEVFGLSLENCKSQAGTETFLHLENVDTNELFVANNDFSKAKTAIQFESGIKPDFFKANNKMPASSFKQNN